MYFVSDIDLNHQMVNYEISLAVMRLCNNVESFVFNMVANRRGITKPRRTNSRKYAKERKQRNPESE